jgi:hypothetical protein
LERKLDELRRAPATRPRPGSRSSKGRRTPVRGPQLSARSRRNGRCQGPGQGPGADRARVRGHTHARGSARIIAEHERRVAEIEALRASNGSNAEAVDQLIARSAAVRDAQLSQLRAKEVEAAEKVGVANERGSGSSPRL